MDLDTFFVSCERLKNSKLNGIPLIIGGGTRGVVASCSYEARKFGVRSAMPMKRALMYCPQAKVIKGDMELYSNLSRQVTEVISEKAPVMEKASIDEFYLDVSGMDRFFGAYTWTSELAARVKRETGLPISYSLSINKTVSKIATGEGKPNGSLEIAQDRVRPFLNPLSIRKIPMIGEQTFIDLSRMGIKRIETLAQVGADDIQRLLGKNGLEIWKKANGIDLTPVRPYHERKSISTEHTFDQDTIDIPGIKTLLVAMIDRLGFQLRSEQWLTSVVTVKVRYANFDTETKQKKIPYTSADHTLNTVVQDLFTALYQRRMRLRLVGVQLSGLVRGTHQVSLFEDTEHMINLYQALDRMKNRYGQDAIVRACALNPGIKV